MTVATLQRPSTPVPAVHSGAADRTGIILGAVDYLISVHDEWESDPTAPDVPTAAFEEALIAIEKSCEGDIPLRCREVHTAVQRLVFEWNEYAGGVRNRNKPVPRFWGAFRSLLNARQGAVLRPMRRPEPVSALLAQKVSYQQIAFHIWGCRGQGPLVNHAGQPDIAKIHEEADKPGSVIPPEWHHPDEMARHQHAVAQSVQRIESVQRLEQENDFTVDPASIEDLLAEGQFPNVIARVKRVSVEEVYQIAKLKGIKPNERPSFADQPATESNSLPAATVTNGQPVAESAKSLKPDKQDSAEVDAEIIRCFNLGMGNSEIRSELSRYNLNMQKVNAVIREHRKTSRPAVVTPEESPETPVNGEPDEADLDSDFSAEDDQANSSYSDM